MIYCVLISCFTNTFGWSSDGSHTAFSRWQTWIWKPVSKISSEVLNDETKGEVTSKNLSKGWDCETFNWVRTGRFTAPSFMVDRCLQPKTIISTLFLASECAIQTQGGSVCMWRILRVPLQFFPSKLYTMDVFNGGRSHFFYIYQRFVPRNRKSIKAGRFHHM